MSNDQNPTDKLESIIVRRQFALRYWNTWELPSLIVLLDGKERRVLRETFDIHWEDLDIHMRLVDECVGTGSAFDQRPRRDKNVKVVYSLDKVPEGIEIKLVIAAMTLGVKEPLLDEKGQPRKLTFERLLPEDAIRGVFNKANAYMKAMKAFQVALEAQETGNEKIFSQLGNALDFAQEGLTPSGALTVKVADVVTEQEKREKKVGRHGKKASSGKLPAIGEEEASSEDEGADKLARELTEALTGIDPDAPEADDVEAAPVPVASASPTPPPAPKPKKEKPSKGFKLGSPEAAAELARLSDAAPANGSNGQR
jgi:hypothetical protein